MSDAPIPFNRPSFVGDEMRYLETAVANGKISGDGPFTRRCESLLAEEIGAARVLLTTSCTHALEMAALLLDIVPGDEVILPAFTFVSGSNAFALRGAVPVFADIRADTLNLDEERLADLVSARTRAIVPTHYAGIGCEMAAILAIAERHGLTVIEDAAHGLFARWQGRPLGSFGALATLSFHETKNITCGEGGALVINDPRLIQRAEIVREKGTNRTQFFRGEVDRYTWVDLGSSYVLSELLAAFLCAQLEARERIQVQRQRLWQAYHDGLASWAREQGFGLPQIPAAAEHPAHLFYLLLPDEPTRAALIAALAERHILAVSHYVPLDASPFAQQHARNPNSCPVAAGLSGRLLRLPLYFGLDVDDQRRVIDAVCAFGRH